jgi:hypothetical protein
MLLFYFYINYIYNTKHNLLHLFSFKTPTLDEKTKYILFISLLNE